MRLSKSDRISGSGKTFDGVLAENPHYRSDIILQGMPQEASTMYDPFYDKKTGQLMWVMANDRMWKPKSIATGCYVSPTAAPSPRAMTILKSMPMID